MISLQPLDDPTKLHLIHLSRNAMTSVKLRYIVLATFLICSLQATRITEAVKIQITPATDNAPNSYTLHLDHVDKLAGAKSTLTYPAE